MCAWASYTGRVSPREQASNPSSEDDAGSRDDCIDTLDFAAVLLELRDDFAGFREEVRRELLAIRTSTNIACRQLKGFGVRLMDLERSWGQVEADVLALASGTPTPEDYDGDDEVKP